ncbi:MAG TPA: UDP-3-O-(3-hydroxymyristoyl)glucosamine N-acyltransferase [Sedimentisphaerales bacterium]|nr:UDP-3-O-(3-hydroxymyristoyl)glucosamine N-acyltransferase [Sedimentisphaerales bacterium]
MKLTIEQLAKRLGAELTGGDNAIGRQIIAVCPIKTADENEVTFITDDKHKAAISQSHAGAVIVSARIDGLDKPQLIVKNVNAALIEALKIFAPGLKAATEGIDPTAKVADNVKIAKGVYVGANVVIDDGVEIGQNSIIGSGCKIGENSKLGEHSRLDSNVVIYHNCCIGNNVIVQANSTIGSTGFGYSFIDGEHRLIPHNGGVIIEDFVEIGANCCVDRAKFGNTIIGAGTKIDNLVQIAHNVVIGKCCLIVALAGIAGSCKLGDGVVLGGQAGLADNIEIGDGTMVSAQAGVMSSVPAGQKLAWTPAIKREDAMRTIGLVLRLPKMARQLKQLSKRIEKLEAAEDDKK